MKKEYIIGLCIVLILIVSVGAFSFRRSAEKKISDVKSFEECVNLGFPVMESYPRQCRAGEKSFTEEVTAPDIKTESPLAIKNPAVRVTEPKANHNVESPLVIKGEARGSWYFEGSFPIRLLDGGGKQIAATTAQAKGEWMTTEFVSFEATITFEKPDQETGTLVLEKDNPSGLPEKADEIRIPVYFSQGAQSDSETRSVKLYYYDPDKDTNDSGQILCSKQGLVPVEREIPITVSPMQDTLGLLLQGKLTDEERREGIATEFPLRGFILRGVVIDDGLLILMFADPENRTNGGACRVNVLKAQIEETAKQFFDAKEIKYKPDTLFQP